jgi:phosphoglycerate dehydrogenase-like enzyme
MPERPTVVLVLAPAFAPELRAVFHAAGTVKNHVTDVCWERGLVVSSSASANAIPAAEYTLAAILFANKRVFQLQQRYRQAHHGIRELWRSREDVPDMRTVQCPHGPPHTSEP